MIADPPAASCAAVVLAQAAVMPVVEAEYNVWTFRLTQGPCPGGRDHKHVIVTFTTSPRERAREPGASGDLLRMLDALGCPDVERAHCGITHEGLLFHWKSAERPCAAA